MGRFLKATGAEDDTTTDDTSPEEGGRFLKAAKKSEGTEIPLLKKEKAVAGVAGRFLGRQFQRVAKTPAAQALIKGFGLLGRPASEVTSAATYALEPIATPGEKEKFVEIRAKNLAARKGGENAYPSELVRAAFPDMKVKENEKFIPDTFQEAPASALGNLKRLGNFAVDVAADPLSYLGLGSMTKAGKIAKRVEAAGRVKEPIRLGSNLSREISAAMKLPESASTIGKAKASGRFGRLAEGVAAQIKGGQRDIASLHVPLTDIQIPLLPRGVQGAIAEAGAAAAKPIVNSAVVQKFGGELRKLFSTRTGNRDYDALVQEFRDLAAARASGQLENATELETRMQQLSKRTGIDRKKLNKMVTEAVETGKPENIQGAPFEQAEFKAKDPFDELYPESLKEGPIQKLIPPEVEVSKKTAKAQALSKTIDPVEEFMVESTFPRETKPISPHVSVDKETYDYVITSADPQIQEAVSSLRKSLGPDTVNELLGAELDELQNISDLPKIRNRLADVLESLWSDQVSMGLGGEDLDEANFLEDLIGNEVDKLKAIDDIKKAVKILRGEGPRFESSELRINALDDFREGAAFAKANPEVFQELMDGKLAPAEAIQKALGPGTIIEDSTLRDQANKLDNYARTLGGKPLIDEVYEETRRQIADEILDDLKANRPQTPEQAKGYIGKMVNYSKEFPQAPIKNNSKLDDPYFQKYIQAYDQIQHTVGKGDIDQDFMAFNQIKNLTDEVLLDLYKMDPRDIDSRVSAQVEFFQDLLIDEDRLALGSATNRNYNPLYFETQVAQNLKRDIMTRLMMGAENGIELPPEVIADLANNAIRDLGKGLPVKIGDDVFGKEINFLGQNDILSSLIERGALPEIGDPNEPLYRKLVRAYPNMFSAPVKFTKRGEGLTNWGWSGLNSRFYRDIGAISNMDMGTVIANIQKLHGNKLPKFLTDRFRQLIELSPQGREIVLKQENFVTNAFNNAIHRRFNKLAQHKYTQLLKNPNKYIQLHEKLKAFEIENAKIYGIVRPSTISPEGGIMDNLNYVGSVYAEALTGSFRNRTNDLTKLNDLAVGIVRDLFEIEPNQLIGNMKAFNRAMKRSPKQVYSDYLRWVKSHEEGHRFIASGSNGDYWTVLPKNMKDEYEQIFKRDREAGSEIFDNYDLHSLPENFSNANGFYLTFPQVMADIAPRKYEFFRRIYTPGMDINIPQVVSAKDVVMSLEKIDPNLVAGLKNSAPDLFKDVQGNFYNKPLTGDPGMDSIIRTLKELSQKQIAIEQSSGLKIIPLSADIDYIAHVMTPEARDAVMDIMKQKGTLPTALTAKEFSTKLANAVRRDLVKVKPNVVDTWLKDGLIKKADAKKLLGKDGIDKLDELLDSEKITDAQFSEALHSLTVSEVNDLAARGELKILGKTKVPEFFHNDPVYSASVRGIRGERARTNAELYDELKTRGIAKPLEQAPDGWIEPNVAELSGFAVEPRVAEHLNAYRKALDDPKSPVEFLNLFDRTQDLWKSWTLAIFPAYHTRNFVGNMWNNYLAGVRDPKVYELAVKLQRRDHLEFTDGLGKRWDTNSLFRAAKENGVIDRGWIGADIQKSISEALENPKLLTLSRRNSILQMGFKVGTAFENNARVAHFIDMLKKGYTAEEAAASVKRYLFDYSDLTQFERKVMKRLFPFYTWTRKNLPLQIQHLVTRPAKFSVIDKARNQIETEGRPQERYLPEWMLKNYPARIRFNKKTGQYEYFLLSSWLPAADIVKVFDISDTAAGMLTPIPKELLQQMFNYDWFMKRKIERIPGEKGKFLGQTMPMRQIHAMKGIRLLNEIDKLTSNEGDFASKVLTLLTGKTYAFDEEKGMVNTYLEAQGSIYDDLIPALRRADRDGNELEKERILQMIEERANQVQ